MRQSFAKQPGPLLVGVIREDGVRASIAAARNGFVAGADAFDIHLARFEDEETTEESLKPLFRDVKKPAFALHYNQIRQAGRAPDDDEARVRKLLNAVRAGASGIDLQGYTFSGGDTQSSLVGMSGTPGLSFARANPAEVTLDPGTIARHTALIDEVHSLGGEVLLSVHTRCYLDRGQVFDLLDLIARRNPDVIKLVCADLDTDEQLGEYLRTVVSMKDRYPGIRIHYHCNGARGRLTRLLAPLCGSYLAFCVERQNETSDANQLPLGIMRQIVDLTERL